jgi:hypothetical protein
MSCRVTGTPIKGEVQGIERGAGRTEVLVEDGLGTVAHLLDESLIDFGAALEDMVGVQVYMTECHTAAAQLHAWPAAGQQVVLCIVCTARACACQHGLQHEHMHPPPPCALPSNQDLQRAVATLEARETTPATEAQWAQLAGVALQAQALAVAERCYAALGDVPRARYLHKVYHAPNMLR